MCSELKTRPLRMLPVSTKQWLLLCFIIREKLINELRITFCFYEMCVLREGNCSCICLWRFVRFSAIQQLMCLLLSHPNDYLFIHILLTAHSPHPQSHTGPMLIILSTLISLLIVVCLFILEIKLSLGRLTVAASAEKLGRQINVYQIVWQWGPPWDTLTVLLTGNGCMDGVSVFIFT